MLVARRSLLQNRHQVTTNIEIHSLIFHPIQFAQIRRNFFLECQLRTEGEGGQKIAVKMNIKIK